MRVLFIGGTGLISTAIARQLLEQGHDVTLFNRGKSENRLPDGAGVIHGDRRDFEAFERTFADKSYDVVVDMVAFHPDETASAIRAFRGRCGQFLHCSTVCVTSGPVQQIPTTETEPYHSIGTYGQNKIACEKLLREAWEGDGFPATILRPSHSYGEGGGLIRAFGPADGWLLRLRAGKPIIVPGDGQGLWAACHVDDVARGFIAVMGKPHCHGQVYQITGEEWMTWDEYHRQVAEVVGGTYDPVFIPSKTLHEAAPAWAGGTWEIFAWPSIFTADKIKRDAGYPGQTIPWREGVRRTVAWLESQGRLTDTDPDGYEDRLIAAWREASAQLPKLPG